MDLKRFMATCFEKNIFFIILAGSNFILLKSTFSGGLFTWKPNLKNISEESCNHGCNKNRKAELYPAVSTILIKSCAICLSVMVTLQKPDRK
jgi:hypothetical protein